MNDEAAGTRLQEGGPGLPMPGVQLQGAAFMHLITG